MPAKPKKKPDNKYVDEVELRKSIEDLEKALLPIKRPDLSDDSEIIEPEIDLSADFQSDKSHQISLDEAIQNNLREASTERNDSEGSGNDSSNANDVGGIKVMTRAEAKHAEECRAHMSGFYISTEVAFTTINNKYIDEYYKIRYNISVLSEVVDKQKEYLKNLFNELLNSAFELNGFTSEDADDILQEVAAEYKAKREEKLIPDLPTKAPILFNDYKKNPEHGEFNALQFLEHFYNPWLSGKGLFRGHISNWDPPLYSALYRMKSDIPSFDTLLPKSQGRKAKDLHKTDSEILEDRRRQSRKWAKANYKKA